MGIFTVALLAAQLLAAAETYVLGPDSQPQAGVPQGVISKHKLEAGQFYPGTPHNYSPYIPARYDASKPTPFMIFLDGSGSLGNGVRVPVVLDNLIAKGDLPPMIGIFVDPGVLPARSDQAQRYARPILLCWTSRRTGVRGQRAGRNDSEPAGAGSHRQCDLCGPRPQLALRRPGQ